jgi:hypothetical protein
MGQIIDGLYTGLRMRAYPMNTAGAVSVDNDINAYIQGNAVESIVSLFAFPTDFIDNEDTGETQSKTVTINRPNNINGYIPQNKKLLTYPYMFLSVDALNDSGNFRFEWFGDQTDESPDTVDFELMPAMSVDPTIKAYPVHYNGASAQGYGASDGSPLDAVMMRGFPQLGYIIDSFRAWLAQRATGEAIAMGAGAVSAVASFATGNALGGVLGLSGLAMQANNAIIEATKGNLARGSYSGSIDVASRTKNFYFRTMAVTDEYARMIDSFFTRYGYAVSVMRVPSRKNRRYYTYIKTNGLNISYAFGSPGITSEIAAKIKSIYDNGVTFWRAQTGVNIGNYTVTNTPLGERE